MPCFSPVKAIRFNGSDPDMFTKSGKRRIFFGNKGAHLAQVYPATVERLDLPCGKCLGCKLRRISDWSIRCMHEASFYPRSSFLTITYKTEYLPPNRSLCHPDIQRFLKRLRQHLRRTYDEKGLKYFMCGEYGEAKGRPHYHMLLFGWDFPDKVRVENNPGCRDALYQSPELDKLWGMGDVKIGEVTGKSAAYVARYSLKKLRHVEGVKEYAATGREAPYILCSKGLGRSWFRRFRSDVFPGDTVVDPEARRPRQVPRFYDKLLEEVDKPALDKVKSKRQEKLGRLNPKDRTPERLAARAEVARLRVENLSRELEKRNRASENSSGSAGR